MRLAVCALSAVLLSGCSWLGSGGHHNDSYSYQYGQGGTYGAAGCLPGGYAGGYTHAGAAGCAPGAGYGVAQNGYMQSGFGAGAGGLGAGAYGAGSGAYGAGAGAFGAGSGAYGAGAGGYGMGAGAFGAGGYGTSTTTLSSAAPFGTAVGGGQVVGGGVQTVQGAPIYVPQPYPAYYGVPTLRGSSYAYQSGYGYGGGAMPFGIEFGGGTEFDMDGDVFVGKETGPNNPDPTLATAEVVSPSISYDKAFKQGYNIGGGMSYDISRNTTLLGNVNYQRNNGQVFENGTFQPGTYDALGNFTSTGPAEVVSGEFTDLEQVTLEGGVRQYVGYNPTFRPYVGAMGGFTHNNSVDLTQSSTSLAAFSQRYIDSGWTPTAAGVVGAEMAVGPRAAIGVESGIRWRDNLDTLAGSTDRWSIPLSLRGRVAF